MSRFILAGIARFKLKAKIYISALRSAFSELQKLQPLKITA